MHGYTPLHFAAIEGNFEVFKLIFDNAETKIPLTETDTKLCEYMLKYYKENGDQGWVYPRP